VLTCTYIHAAKTGRFGKAWFTYLSGLCYLMAGRTLHGSHQLRKVAALAARKPDPLDVYAKRMAGRLLDGSIGVSPAAVWSCVAELYTQYNCWMFMPADTLAQAMARLDRDLSQTDAKAAPDLALRLRASRGACALQSAADASDAKVQAAVRADLNAVVSDSRSLHSVSHGSGVVALAHYHLALAAVHRHEPDAADTALAASQAVKAVVLSMDMLKERWHTINEAVRLLRIEKYNALAASKLNYCDHIEFQ
jgi:hypothetical protein